MQSFIALYRGETVTSSRLVALSTDPNLVGRFAGELLERTNLERMDPIEAEIESGRQRALQLVQDEAEEMQDNGPR